MSYTVVLQDSFTDADGVLLEDHAPEVGSWHLEGDYAYINTNRLSNGNYSNSFYTAFMVTAYDMAIEMIWFNISFETMTLLCRAHDLAHLFAYGLEVSPGNVDIVKYWNGTKSVLKTVTMTVNAGDKIKFETIGSALNVYQNDVLIDTYTDTVLLYGVLGFLCAQNGSAQSWDDAVGYAEILSATGNLFYLGVG